MLEILKQVSLKGGEILKKYFLSNNRKYQKGLKVSYKTNIHDLLTEADKKSQSIVIDYIKKETKTKFPGINIGFIGEEGIFEKGEYMFIIDPLDGTTNFATGIDHFGVSIAVARNNMILSGVIYDVMNGNLYWAEKGKGAYKNGEKLMIDKDRKLNESTIFAYFSSNLKTRETTTKILNKIADKIRCYRLLGAVTLDLSYVASGIGDIVLALNSGIWDVAAGGLIVKEAGGEVVDLKGQKVVFDFENPQKKYQHIAASKKLLKELFAGIK